MSVRFVSKISANKVMANAGKVNGHNSFFNLNRNLCRIHTGQMCARPAPPLRYDAHNMRQIVRIKNCKSREDVRRITASTLVHCSAGDWCCTGLEIRRESILAKILKLRESK